MALDSASSGMNETPGQRKRSAPSRDLSRSQGVWSSRQTLPSAWRTGRDGGSSSVGRARSGRTVGPAWRSDRGGARERGCDARRWRSCSRPERCRWSGAGASGGIRRAACPAGRPPVVAYLEPLSAWKPLMTKGDGANSPPARESGSAPRWLRRLPRTRTA